VSVYLVANLQIEDRAEYQKYEAGFMEIFGRYEGRLLAVDEKQAVVEGEWPHTRTVLMEFPSEEAVRAWYDSADYQALAKHRWAASEGAIAIIQGLG
jgi:uncharacterized protein (DUF1330 family)